MKIKKILVSQPKPEGKSFYYDIEEKFGVKMVFRPFIKIEPVLAKDFRQQRIEILDYTAIIFTSKVGIDHFFRLCGELRKEMPKEMRYFCSSEKIAAYLQKYIDYRKRKVSFPAQETPQAELLSKMIELMEKHEKTHSEKYLLISTDVYNDTLLKKLDEKNFNYQKAVMYRTVSNDFGPDESFDYDMLVFFSPSGINSLMKNFPNFEQGEISIVCTKGNGGKTAEAVRNAGLRLDLECSQSIATELANFIKENHKQYKK